MALYKVKNRKSFSGESRNKEDGSNTCEPRVPSSTASHGKDSIQLKASGSRSTSSRPLGGVFGAF